MSVSSNSDISQNESSNSRAQKIMEMRKQLNHLDQELQYVEKRLETYAEDNWTERTTSEKKITRTRSCDF